MRVIRRSVAPDVIASGHNVLPRHRYTADNMTTFSNSEAKAHLSEMLRDLGHGDGVIITRRGRPCGRLTAVKPVAADKPSLATLRAPFPNRPTLTTRTSVTSGPRPEDGGHDDR